MNVMETLRQVPFWVWLVLGYGLWIGIKGFGARKVSLAMATLLPLVFLGLSLSSLVMVVGTAPAVGLAWFLALLLGAALGWFFLASEPLEVHRRKGTIVVPGTWVILVLFLAIFVTKFVYGYEAATHPELADTPTFLLLVFGISGLATGIVTGRTGRLYNAYFQTPLAEKD